MQSTVLSGHIGNGTVTLRAFIRALSQRKDGWGAAARCLDKLDGTTAYSMQQSIDAKFTGEQRDHYTDMLGDVVGLMKRGVGQHIQTPVDDWHPLGHGGHQRRVHLT